MSKIEIAETSGFQQPIVKDFVMSEVSAALPTLDMIQKLQSSMIPMQCEQPEPIHRFAKGMYMRELTVPAGMLIVGKIHKHQHFLMVMSGKAEIISEHGREIVEGGYIGTSEAGVKRVVLALEDTRFITLHINKDDSRDLEVIEAEHIECEPEIMLEEIKRIEQ